MRAISLALSILILTAGTAHAAEDPIMIGPKYHPSPISLYQGDLYVPQHNQLRICIRERESRHDYRAVSSTGKYRGAYQLSPELGVGAGWMIQKYLRTSGTPKPQAEHIGHLLREAPVNQWAPYYQDLAFWLVWDGGHGRNHWDVPGQSCF